MWGEALNGPASRLHDDGFNIIILAFVGYVLGHVVFGQAAFAAWYGLCIVFGLHWAVRSYLRARRLKRAGVGPMAPDDERDR